MTAHDWLNARLLGMSGAMTNCKAEWERQREIAKECRALRQPANERLDHQPK